MCLCLLPACDICIRNAVLSQYLLLTLIISLTFSEQNGFFSCVLQYGMSLSPSPMFAVACGRPRYKWCNIIRRPTFWATKIKPWILCGKILTPVKELHLEKALASSARHCCNAWCFDLPPTVEELTYEYLSPEGRDLHKGLAEEKLLMKRKESGKEICNHLANWANPVRTQPSILAQ